MKGLFSLLGLSFKPTFRIDSRESLVKAAETFGILPFFPNNIKGFSVEEMCVPGMLFGGNKAEGCWEWKGPVIRKRTTIYGKFFKRKAGFVSLDVMSEFLKYRRSAYPIKKDSVEEMLFEIIRENDSLSSTELKHIIFNGSKKRNCFDVPDREIDFITPTKIKNKSLESPLQRLQMGGWIIISDFEYKKTRKGERYGWGVARYSTPEYIFHDTISKFDSFNSTEENLEILISKIKEKIPGITKKALFKLLK